MHISIVPAPWGDLKILSFFFNSKCGGQHSSEIELHCRLPRPTTNPDINMVPVSLQVLLLSNTSLPFSEIMDSLRWSSLSQIAESFYSFLQSSYRLAASMKLSHKQSLGDFQKQSQKGHAGLQQRNPALRMAEQKHGPRCHRWFCGALAPAWPEPL